eukprot:m.322778 g.322778  ORF g.322778 m.322778 type:complete len:110 (-) comp27613_c0_seq1:1739-2068(-)
MMPSTNSPSYICPFGQVNRPHPCIEPFANIPWNFSPPGSSITPVPCIAPSWKVPSYLIGDGSGRHRFSVWDLRLRESTAINLRPMVPPGENAVHHEGGVTFLLPVCSKP